MNQIGAGIGIGLGQEVALGRGRPRILDFDQGLAGSDVAIVQGVLELGLAESG